MVRPPNGWALSLRMSQRREDVESAGPDQLFSDDAAQRFRTTGQIRDVALFGKIAFAIRARYEGTHPNAVGRRLRVRAERHHATSRQRTANLSLGSHAPLRRMMVERSKHLDQVCTLFETLDTDRALTRRGQAFLGLQYCADARVESEPLEARRRENNRGVLAFIELAQTGLHIAAQGNHIERRIARSHLALAAQAGGPDGCTGQQR